MDMPSLVYGLICCAILCFTVECSSQPVKNMKLYLYMNEAEYWRTRVEHTLPTFKGACGSGVYVTSMSPAHASVDLAQTYWGNSRFAQSGDVDYYIEMTVANNKEDLLFKPCEDHASLWYTTVHLKMNSMNIQPVTIGECRKFTPKSSRPPYVVNEVIENSQQVISDDSSLEISSGNDSSRAISGGNDSSLALSNGWVILFSVLLSWEVLMAHKFTVT